MSPTALILNHQSLEQCFFFASCHCDRFDNFDDIHFLKSQPVKVFLIILFYHMILFVCKHLVFFSKIILMTMT